LDLKYIAVPFCYMMEAVGCAESNSHSNHSFYIDCSEMNYNRLTFIDICSLSVIAKSEPNMNAVTFVSYSKVLGVSDWSKNVV